MAVVYLSSDILVSPAYSAEYAGLINWPNVVNGIDGINKWKLQINNIFIFLCIFDGFLNFLWFFWKAYHTVPPRQNFPIDQPAKPGKYFQQKHKIFTKRLSVATTVSSVGEYWPIIREGVNFMCRQREVLEGEWRWQTSRLLLHVWSIWLPSGTKTSNRVFYFCIRVLFAWVMLAYQNTRDITNRPILPY